MSHFSQRRAPASSTTRLVVAWLCVLLILVLGSVHLLHQHPAGDDPACSLCTVAHLTVIATPVTAQLVVPQVFTPFTQQSTLAPPPRLVPPSLYVRPPPVPTRFAL